MWLHLGSATPVYVHARELRIQFPETIALFPRFTKKPPSINAKAPPNSLREQPDLSRRNLWKGPPLRRRLRRFTALGQDRVQLLNR